MTKEDNLTNNLINEDIEKYLLENENKELLRFITCGSVDDGKSTLIGKLLYDSKVIYEDQLNTLAKESKKHGNTDGDMDLALLLDGLQSEREQGITIDVAYRYFSTPKRKFIIADTPGHEQYTRNMVTGASTADLAIILIDARTGVLTQTKRHSYIANLLGIRHIVIAINKMDLIDYSETRYKEIVSTYQFFANEIALSDVQYIPISALQGDNIVDESSNMPWYRGKSLISILENINIIQDRNTRDFRFPVQLVNRPNLDFRGYSGTVASGSVSVGDAIIALPSLEKSIVKSIVSYDGDLQNAEYSMAVTLVLEDEIDISRGDMIVKSNNIPNIADNFDAYIVWMSDTPLDRSSVYYIKQCTLQVQAKVNKFYYKKDMSTLITHEAYKLEINEIGLANIQLHQKIIYDPYNINRQTGRFIIMDRITNNTVGIGLIKSLDNPIVSKHKRVSLFEKKLHAFIKERYPHWWVTNILLNS